MDLFGREFGIRMTAQSFPPKYKSNDNLYISNLLKGLLYNPFILPDH